MIIKYFNHIDLGVEDIIPLERITETENNTENYFGDETRHGTICFPTRQIFGTTFHLVLTFYNLFYLHDKPLLKRQR